MKKTSVIIAAGIGILAITTSFRYFSADEELPGVESPVHHDPRPVNRKGHSGQQRATEVAEKSSSAESNALWVVPYYIVTQANGKKVFKNAKFDAARTR